MEESSKVHVGLDVHKDSIDIACAQAGRQGEVLHVGTQALRGIQQLAGCACARASGA